MCTKVRSPLWVISSVLLITAVVFLSAGSASAVGNTPDYRGDPNSTHAIFDWVFDQPEWTTTLFEKSPSNYQLDPTVPAASDDGTDTTIDLPNFIDPLSFKLMRIQMFFDGPVSGDLIAIDIDPSDPLPTQWQVVDGSVGQSVFHWIDVEIFPNPDWERITIFGNSNANIIPGNLLTIEVDTVSLPEPATLGLLLLGGLTMLRCRRSSHPEFCRLHRSNRKGPA